MKRATIEHLGDTFVGIGCKYPITGCYFRPQLFVNEEAFVRSSRILLFPSMMEITSIFPREIGCEDIEFDSRN